MRCQWACLHNTVWLIAGKAGAVVGAFGFGQLFLVAGISTTLGLLALTNFIGKTYWVDFDSKSSPDIDAATTCGQLCAGLCLHRVCARARLTKGNPLQADTVCLPLLNTSCVQAYVAPSLCRRRSACTWMMLLCIPSPISACFLHIARPIRSASIIMLTVAYEMRSHYAVLL